MFQRATYERAIHLALVLLLVMSFCLSPSLRVSSDALGKEPQPGLRSLPVSSIENGYLKAYGGEGGRFVVGTTGGDPDSYQDDNKRLLFGYSNDIGTSFATLRIVDGAQVNDYRLGTADWNSTGIAPSIPPANDGASMTTVYEQDGVRVEARLYFTLNESTGRFDTTAIQYTVTNNTGGNRSVGLRMLLDIMAGNNDGAPYFIDGSGYVTRQSEWTGANIPSFWVAYESPVYASSGLKARGQLTGGTTVKPDRFVIADWSQATYTTWDYTVDPHDLVTNDSATILYYNPVALAPGESRVVRTYYGITRAGGVSMPQLTSMEVTQGVQDLTNSVPLIQNRPTYVRAHVRSTLGIIGGVTAQLVGKRGNQELPGSPLMPANSGGSIDAIENPDRQQLGQSYFFALPTEWLTGTVDLELRGLNRVIDCADTQGHPNDCKTQISFEPGRALAAHFYGFTWAQSGQVHAPNLTNITAAQRQIAVHLPGAGTQLGVCR